MLLPADRWSVFVGRARIIAVGAVFLACFALIGCGYTPSRDQYGDVIPDAYPEWLLAKLDMPHVASDGRTPAQIREQYLAKIKAGDAQAAEEALAVVTGVIRREGGLFSPELADLAVEALGVRPDTEFLRLLIRQLPKESAFYYRSPDAPGTGTRGSEVHGVGESRDILVRVPSIALPELMWSLRESSGPWRSTCLLLGVVFDIQKNDRLLPWNKGREILSICNWYPGEAAVRESVAALTYELFRAYCPPTLGPPDPQELDNAYCLAQSGRVDEAWHIVNGVLEYRRLQGAVVAQVCAAGVTGARIEWLAADLSAQQLRIGIRLESFQAVSLVLDGVRDLRANMVLSGSSVAVIRASAREERSRGDSAIWKVRVVMDGSSIAAIECVCTSISSR